MTDKPIIKWFAPDDDITPFPEVHTALTEPDGLIAAGGNLKPARLLMAYRNGIFPWFNPEDPILWWSPSQRSVIYSYQLHISRSLKRVLKQEHFKVTINQAFRQVICDCAAPRPESLGTWITEEMIDAYCELHKMGYAHSVECWQNDALVGGMYGIQLGKIFFGESMYSKKPNASKVAIVKLFKKLDIKILDCQIHSPHLASMGATEITRYDFLQLLKEWK